MFISGPTLAGKSEVARFIARSVYKDDVHFLRMQPAKDGHSNAIIPLFHNVEKKSKTFSSAHTAQYTPERIFETLPDGLKAIRRLDRYGFTIIEADTDPCLRYAYPYDYRVFVMPMPQHVHDVLRSPRQAAEALQTVMQDTASFATEIFGLSDASVLDENLGLSSRSQNQATGNTVLEHVEIAEQQFRQFLRSPIGAEIAARVQLQPDYHALVESDVVIINKYTQGNPEALEDCCQRLENLLGRIQHDTRRHSLLFWGDIRDTHDANRRRLLQRFKQLLTD